MSSGPKLAWRDAYGHARSIAAELQPYVKRIKVAGSLRRLRPVVGDLELVCEPHLVEVDLLGGTAPDVREIRRVLHSRGRWVKGGDRFMQIEDVDERKGLSLDLSLVWPPAQWGSILAIRTGPAELGHLCMMRFTDRQLYHAQGQVLRLSNREVLPTPDEESFFRLAGLPCWPPANRDELLNRIRSGQDLEGVVPRA